MKKLGACSIIVGVNIVLYVLTGWMNTMPSGGDILAWRPEWALAQLGLNLWCVGMLLIDADDR